LYSTTTFYDADGRENRKLLSDGSEERYLYDSYGRKIFTTIVPVATSQNPFPEPTYYIQHEYDVDGNKTKDVYPEVYFGDEAYEISYEYDDGGRMVSTTNGNNVTTLMEYDIFDNLSVINPPDTDYDIYLDYDINNKMTRYAVGDYEMLFSYNGHGELESVQSPDFGIMQVTRESISGGNRETTTYNENRTEVVERDYSQRLTNRYFSEPGKEDEEIIYSNDLSDVSYGLGRLGQVEERVDGDTVGVHNLQYDAAGRVVRHNHSFAGRLWPMVQEYRADGALESITYPTGTEINYSPNNDEWGQPGQITIRKNGESLTLATLNYLPGGGPLAQLNYFEGTLYQTIQYDRAYRTKSVQVVHNDLLTEDDIILNRQYAYDSAGNITGISDLVDSSMSWTYAYDPANRLTSATAQDAANGVYTFGYGDDGLGNRQTYSANGDAYTYTYGDGSPNRLVQVAGPGGQNVTYTYDSEGRITGRNGDIFTYDAKGRLDHFENADHSKVAYYQYDYLGRRIVKGVANKTITLFHYDQQGRLIAETDMDGNVQVEYIWLDWRPIAMIVPGGSTPDDDTVDDDVIDDDTVDDDTIDDDTTDDDSADDDTGDDDDDDCGGCNSGDDLLENLFEQDKMGVMEQDYEVYAIHTDHLGSPVAVSDMSGQVVWTHRFSPFGKTIELNEDVDGDGVKLTLNLRFPGQYYDAESGLHYNWHRYYDPETGRFFQHDCEQGNYLTNYVYTGQNPIKYSDRKGLYWTGQVTFGTCCIPVDVGNPMDGDWYRKIVTITQTFRICQCNWRCDCPGCNLWPSDSDDPYWQKANHGTTNGFSSGGDQGANSDIENAEGCACGIPSCPKDGVLNGHCDNEDQVCEPPFLRVPSR